MNRIGLAAVTAFGLAGVLALTASSSDAAPPSKSTPTVLSAVVNLDGTLARGVGAISAKQLGADGTYTVNFNRDVSQCTYTATAGNATSFPADDAVTFGVSPAESDVNGVYLIEYDAILGRDSYSSGFHILVVCP